MSDPSDKFDTLNFNDLKKQADGVIVWRGIKHDTPYEQQRDIIVDRTRAREAYLRDTDRMYFPNHLPESEQAYEQKCKRESVCSTFLKYMRHADRHEFDLYLPRNMKQSDKQVVHVHGGGWHRGKNDVFWRGGPAAASMFASHGIPCAAVTYRLSNPGPLAAPMYGTIVGVVGGVILATLASIIIMIVSAIKYQDAQLSYLIKYMYMYIPLGLFTTACLVVLLIWALRPKVTVKEQLDDIIASIDYIKKNAHEWKIHPKEVVLCGHSAGAHLSTYLSMSAPLLQKAGIIYQSSTSKMDDHTNENMMKLKGVISISGLYNLRDGPADIPFVKMFFYMCYSSAAIGYSKSILYKYSPIHYISNVAYNMHHTNSDDEHKTPTDNAWLNKELENMKQKSENSLIDTNHYCNDIVLPPIYVINAEKDVYIDVDGAKFIEAQRCVNPKAYRSVAKNTTHANIAFNLGRNKPTKWIMGMTMDYFNLQSTQE